MTEEINEQKRGRGRPPIKKAPIGNIVEERNPRHLGGTLGLKIEENPYMSGGRSQRKKMERGGKLNVPDYLLEKGKKYYWEVDRPGALESRLQAFWCFVVDDHGNRVTMTAGGGETHYLMAIDEDLYNEDKARYIKQVNEKMAGNSDITIGRDEYKPRGLDGSSDYAISQSINRE